MAKAAGVKAAKAGMAAAKKSGRQAVVVIHGMGEQMPMATLRSFVDAVWVTDDSLFDPARPDSNTGAFRTHNPVWSRPDGRNRSFELRRITTEQPLKGMRTDFYEFYWAHLMEGTTWNHLGAWISDLLLRRPDRVPRDVFPAWIALWVVALCITGAVLYTAYATVTGTGDPWLKGASVLVGILGAAAYAGFQLFKSKSSQFMLGYFGDVARYVRATPTNVARRQEIREKGVELLETLMGVEGADAPDAPPVGPDTVWKTPYDRIIVVAHSLGSIVAYDVLQHAFARSHRRLHADPAATQPHRDKLEAYLRDTPADAFDTGHYQNLQAACLNELKDQKHPWIVSDFVTLGCPLTHAEFLLAYDLDDVDRQQGERSLPTCPPQVEWDAETERKHVSFWNGPLKGTTRDEKSTRFRYPHHAAHFAFTRWTNLHSKAQNIAWGDLISGPVGNLFGLKGEHGYLKGVKDVPVLPDRDENGNPLGDVPLFTHTKYWDATVRTGPGDTGKVPHHIEKLREALNLKNR
ncbi:hypothetical protein [Pararhizobium sp.]|uniref:hypothetical protein n=1 Tax=Pararhizobium sp. TaxID=1977563 RepID=UPI0027225818|nr:hypothetical protein [Pararhizobium sp.]MDO9417278.1 hypothetical protein [Pararhizobium sp.]